MSKQRAGFETATDMDVDPGSLPSTKRRARKRKEEPHDSSDSEGTTRKTRTKRKPAIESSSDDKSIPAQCNRSAHASAKQLVKLLSEVRELSDLRLIKKIAMQLYETVQGIETENAVLKQKLSSTISIDQKMNAMEEKLNCVVRSISEINNAGKPQMTYAEKLRNSAAASVETAKTTKKHVVTIFPELNSKIMDSDQTKNAIISSVAPAKEKLKIISVRKINNKGVLIETKTAEDLRSVMENEKLKAAGLTVGVPAKAKPRVLIKSIPSTLQDKEILSAIRHQNMDDYPKDKFQENFKLAFKTGPRGKETTNWVAEVSPDIREKLIKEGRIYIQWHACYVQDFLSTSRCYKCQSFGHVSKYCKAPVETCGHCAENGHSHKDCSAPKDHPRCVNCKRAGKPHEHSSRSRDCPAYQNALKLHISKIDYGQK